MSLLTDYCSAPFSRANNYALDYRAFVYEAVTVECAVGYQLKSGNTSFDATCNPDLMWNTSKNCTSEYTVKLRLCDSCWPHITKFIVYMN